MFTSQRTRPARGGQETILPRFAHRSGSPFRIFDSAKTWKGGRPRDGRESGLASTNCPADSVVDNRRLDECIGCELKSATVRVRIRVDADRHTATHFLYEDLVGRVLVNPQTTVFEKDREVLIVVPEPP